MAQIDIRKLTKINKERNMVHDEVFATYTVFDDGVEKYLQIDTYGKAGRVNPEKVSQSLQFNREAALYLANLFIEEFDLEIH